MNKLTIIALALLIFAGCKKSSNNSPVILAGTWHLSKYTDTLYANDTVSAYQTYLYNNNTYYETFNTGNTGMGYNTASVVPPVGPFKFTYSLSGSNLILNFSQQTINGVAYEPTQLQASVKTLTSNSLILVTTYALTGTANISVSEKETQYFVK